MQDSRYTIAEVPSGKVEMVLVKNAFLVLQFNAECKDVLHICKAMCCRARSGLNVILQPDEAAKFAHRIQKELPVLQGKKEDDTCVYLSDEALCTVHEDKPKMCASWHCSPGGKGQEIIVRDSGWFLSPMGVGVVSQETTK